jgi:hypothetical protein
MMMNRVGVGNDQLQSFLSDDYKRSVDLGLTPQNIASYLRDLLEFSNTLVFSQIPAYLEQKKQEKDQLEKKVQELKDDTELLQIEKSDSENILKMAMTDYKTSTEQLEWHSGLREELAKYGIPINDISQFAKMIDGVRGLGYDPVKITKEILNLEVLRAQYKSYQSWIPTAKNELEGLDQSRSALEQLIQSHRQTLSIYNELESFGFGLKELKILYHTVDEISIANNIPIGDGVKKFLKDVDDNYDDRLGFASKVEKLDLEITRLTQQLNELREQLSVHPLVGTALLRLVQNGLNEEEMISIAGLIRNEISSRRDPLRGRGNH